MRRHAVPGGEDDVARLIGYQSRAAFPDSGLGILVGPDTGFVAPHGGDTRGGGSADTHHDAPVRVRVAVGGKRHVHGAVHQQEPGTLLFGRIVERNAWRVVRRTGDLDRESRRLLAGRAGDGLKVPVGIGESTAPGLEPGREIDGPRCRIDHRRGGRSEVGRQVRAPDRCCLERRPEGPAPLDGTRGGVDAVGHGLLGGHNDCAVHYQWLRVHGPQDRRREQLSEGRPLDHRGSEARFVVVPVVAEIVVAGGGHVRSGGGSGHHNRCQYARSYNCGPAHHDRQTSCSHFFPACAGEHQVDVGATLVPGGTMQPQATTGTRGDPTAHRCTASENEPWLNEAGRLRSVRVCDLNREYA